MLSWTDVITGRMNRRSNELMDAKTVDELTGYR